MKTCLLILFLLPIMAISQDKPAYVLYDSAGGKTTYGNLLEALKSADVILFGELHNNPIAHWLQLEVTKDLNNDRDLILGAEMLEADNQGALDLYLKGEIDQNGLDSVARLWKNYNTDYAPLVDFAKTNNLTFVASNIPRRYASMVYRGGFEALDTLPENEKAWIAPLPIQYDPELPGYKAMLEMMGGHGGENLPKAQAIKDATMAHFIVSYYEVNKLFIHYNGTYHSKDYEGILWYLQNKRPDLKYATIHTVEQVDISSLLEEHRGSADYIICVDEDMTKTY